MQWLAHLTLSLIIDKCFSEPHQTLHLFPMSKKRHPFCPQMIRTGWFKQNSLLYIQTKRNQYKLNPISRHLPNAQILVFLLFGSVINIQTALFLELIKLVFIISLIEQKNSHLDVAKKGMVVESSVLGLEEISL